MKTIKFQKIRDVKSPERGTDKSAGIDFFVPLDVRYNHTLYPGEGILIPSGIKAVIPKGHALIAFNKSGVATKRGLSVGACVVDEDYQGEIHLHVYNRTSRVIDSPKPGDKLVQFLLIPVEYPKIEMYENNIFSETTERGEGGFGSTGTK